MTGRILERGIGTESEFRVIAEFEYWGDAEVFFTSPDFKKLYPPNDHETKMQVSGMFSGWTDHEPEKTARSPHHG